MRLPTLHLAEAFIHDLDRVLLPISGNIAIRWYGMAYLAGFVVAWLLLRWMSKTGRSHIPPEKVSDFMMYAIGGVLIGGRLGYCIFYDQSLLVPPTGIFHLWDGGMSSHGGIAGVITAVWLFCYRNNLSMLHVLDCSALAVPFGLFFGRIANFINAELWGNALPQRLQDDSPWWAVRYPDELKDFAAYDKDALASMSEIPIAAGIDPTDWARTVQDYRIEGEVGQQATALFNHWVAEIIGQVRAGNEAIMTQLHDVLTAYYPSQLIQAAAEGPLLWIVLAIVWLKPRKRGIVGAVFMLVYGMLRIATEEFRQPDEGIAIILGLQRGQLLSVAMVAVGVISLIWIGLKKGERVGGLLSPSRHEEA